MAYITSIAIIVLFLSMANVTPDAGCFKRGFANLTPVCEAPEPAIRRANVSPDDQQLFPKGGANVTPTLGSPAGCTRVESMEISDPPESFDSKLASLWSERGNSTAAPKQINKRPRRSYSELSAVFCSEEYAWGLCYKESIPEFDNGRGKTCVCDRGCQQKAKDVVPNIHQGLVSNWGSQPGQGTKEVRDLTLLQDLFNKKSNDGKQQYFLGNDWEVCQNFYMRARGIQVDYYYSWAQKVKRYGPQVSFVNESQRVDRRAEKQMLFEQWLTQYANHFGDHMPTANRSDDNSCSAAHGCQSEDRVIPQRDFKTVYDEYVQDMKDMGEEALTCSYSYAVQLFNNQTGIRLARDKGSFSTCKVCESFQRRILEAKTKEEREQLKRLRRRHVSKQQRERKQYYSNRAKAILNKNRYLSIIVDGMDQQKTNVPLASQKVNFTTQLTQRVMGVRVHGIRTYVFVTDDTVKGGANYIISVLHYVLKDLAARNELPNSRPTLFLQLDNCSGTLKFIFCFTRHTFCTNLLLVKIYIQW